MENGLACYGPFIKEIKELIYRRQYETMKRVNAELIQLYWEIGEEIDRQQREQGWSFYIEYSQNANLQPSRAEIQTQNLYPSGAEIRRASLPWKTRKFAPST
jgi:hypothetical protein